MKAKGINAAVDQLHFTKDVNEVIEKLNGDDEWVALGVVNEDWVLGRISKEKLNSSLAPLYEDDFMATLGRLIANGVPVDPPLSDEGLRLF